MYAEQEERESARKEREGAEEIDRVREDSDGKVLGMEGGEKKHYAPHSQVLIPGNGKICCCVYIRHSAGHLPE